MTDTMTVTCESCSALIQLVRHDPPDGYTMSYWTVARDDYQDHMRR